MAEQISEPNSVIFDIATDLEGAPIVRAALALDANTGALNGSAEYYQGGTQPDVFVSDMSGSLHTVTLGHTKQFFTLHQKGNPKMPGQSSIGDLVVALDSVWGTSGHASYTVNADMTQRKTYEDVPVAVKWGTPDA